MSSIRHGCPGAPRHGAPDPRPRQPEAPAGGGTLLGVTLLGVTLLGGVAWLGVTLLGCVTLCMCHSVLCAEGTQACGPFTVPCPWVLAAITLHT